MLTLATLIRHEITPLFPMLIRDASEASQRPGRRPSARSKRPVLSFAAEA